MHRQSCTKIKTKMNVKRIRLIKDLPAQIYSADSTKKEPSMGFDISSLKRDLTFCHRAGGEGEK